jgi:D-sedoheptulose 7-phosphate isomerase
MTHPDVSSHVGELEEALERFRPWATTLAEWGEHLAQVLSHGGRLLACGNGGSAAEAQHLTAELVGRFRGERRPFSAIALAADAASLTAIGNDYDFDQIFAREVVAHGRPGDVLLLVSTSGMSTNVLTAANVAKAYGITTWALTGRGPNPLASACHNAVTVDADQTATVHEVHLLAVHLLCAAVDQALGIEGRTIEAEVSELDSKQGSPLVRQISDQVGEIVAPPSGTIIPARRADPEAHPVPEPLPEPVPSATAGRAVDRASGHRGTRGGGRSKRRPGRRLPGPTTGSPRASAPRTGAADSGTPTHHPAPEIERRGRSDREIGVLLARQPEEPAPSGRSSDKHPAK